MTLSLGLTKADIAPFTSEVDLQAMIGGSDAFVFTANECTFWKRWNRIVDDDSRYKNNLEVTV
jgi:hypothetical protein